jgi:hypothetical protein
MNPEEGYLEEPCMTLSTTTYEAKFPSLAMPQIPKSPDSVAGRVSAMEYLRLKYVLHPLMDHKLELIFLYLLVGRSKRSVVELFDPFSKDPK